MFAPAFGAAISGGYGFGQVVEMVVTRILNINFADLRGHTPPTCGQKGRSVRPLVRRGPVSPNNVFEKRRKVCVLGKGCGHLTSASELNLGQFGARGGASRGRFLPIPPFDHKRRGYTPLRSFPTI